MMQALWLFLWSAIVPLAMRVLVGVGIGWVTYSGVGAGLDALTTNIMNNYNGLGADILAVLNLAGFSVVINTLISSFVISATFRGLNATGIISRVSWKKPS